MKAFEVKFITFENLFRAYLLFAENEEKAILAAKHAFPKLSKVLSVNEIEVK